MCHHDGFIADIQGCHDRCFPKNHTFPPEMVASTRYGMYAQVLLMYNLLSVFL